MTRTPDPLPAGGVTEVKCTASYTVDQADLDAGSVTNEATAKAKYNGNDVPSNQAKLTVNAMRSPALGLDKDSTDKANGYSSVGDVLNYTYDLTNIGNVTLDAPYSVEDKVENTTPLTVTCPVVPLHLAPGDPAVQCTATYVVTQDDLDAAR